MVDLLDSPVPLIIGIGKDKEFIKENQL